MCCPEGSFLQVNRCAGNGLVSHCCPSLWLAGDILDFSKIEAHSLELRPTALDLRVTLEAALALVAADAERKGLALAYTNFTADIAAASFWGDPLRIRQVCRPILSPRPCACLRAHPRVMACLRDSLTPCISRYAATDLYGLCHLLVLFQIPSRGRPMPAHDSHRYCCHVTDPTRSKSV